MTDTPSDYDCNIDILMPGMEKASHYILHIKGATSMADAVQKAEDEWRKQTTPVDIRVKKSMKSLVK